MKEAGVKSALRHGRFTAPFQSEAVTSRLSGDHPQAQMTPLSGGYQNPYTANHDNNFDKRVMLPHTVPLQQPGHARGRSKVLRFHTRGFGRSGPIQSRTTTSSLLFKKWSESYWLHVYPATVNIFENKETMELWKGATDDDREHKKPIKKLVKLSINFDTLGRLQAQVDEHNRRKAEDATDTGLGEEASDVPRKDFIGVPYHYIMEEVRSKFYSRNGPLLHTCKISYFCHTGRTINSAYGSADPTDLKRIRSVFRYCIRLVAKAEKHFQRKKSQDRTTTISDGASIISGVSGMNKSTITALSNTHYGEQTMSEKELLRHKKRRHKHAK
mmetsp:Transcript_12840/g.19252  ORF Transcript_12840/g.19252 Transcript_12840/m.19252 type:complete len:328 (-) Transcript_12840:214-1197(-)